MWKEYYILGSLFGRRWQIINYWHEFKYFDGWHLICIYREYRNRGWEYNFSLLGFRLRIFKL